MMSVLELSLTAIYFVKKILSEEVEFLFISGQLEKYLHHLKILKLFGDDSTDLPKSYENINSSASLSSKSVFLPWSRVG